MTNEESLETLRTLMCLSVEVQGPDLEGFLGRIAEAEAVGPITDPTLYRRGGPAHSAVRAVADAARLRRARSRCAFLLSSTFCIRLITARRLTATPRWESWL